MTLHVAASRTLGLPGVPQQGEARLPGNSGMWLFVLGDMFIFLAYFVVFMVYRHGNPSAFLDAQRNVDLLTGVLNTLILVTSSYLVALAVAAARRGSSRRASSLVTAAACCGLLFMAIKAYEWGRLMHEGYTFTHGDYFMFFFAFTGVHAFHVLMGLIVLAVVRRELHHPEARVHVVEAGAIYWHMVDLLWVVLFALLYVMR
jgi:nitric oxide reductase NorE protein